MHITVWGLGCVGAITSAGLAISGHDVIGVDRNAERVSLLATGQSPVPRLPFGDFIKEALATDRLRFTQDGGAAVQTTDISIISVGTSLSAQGDISLEDVCDVTRLIGKALRSGSSFHTIILRSTVPPGTCRFTVIPLLEESSGRRVGEGIGLAVNPEFLREKSAINDFMSPEYILIGAHDEQSRRWVDELYQPFSARRYFVGMEEAEMVKLTNNAFHAIKVGFANEVARICDRVGIDAASVMRLVCADTRLNISPAYLQPGPPFGGSCLPKDVEMLTRFSSTWGVQVPILDAVLPSNNIHRTAFDND